MANIYKQNRLMLPIKEFLVVKTQSKYEITDIDMNKVVIFYRKFASNLTILENYVDMPKGYYRIFEEGGVKYLEITNQDILNQYYSIQLCREMEITSSPYNPTGDIDVNRLLEHTNELVQDMKFMFGYIKNIAIIADGIEAVKVTSELRPLTTWYMDENGRIATIPVSELFEKFDEMVNRVYTEVHTLLLADYNNFSASLRQQFNQHSSDLNKLHQDITGAINALSQAEQKAIKDLADARELSINKLGDVRELAIKNLADARELALNNLATSLEISLKNALNSHKAILAQQLTDLKEALAKQLQDMIDLAVGDRGVMPNNTDWHNILQGNWTIINAIDSGFINIPPNLYEEDNVGVLNYTINESGNTGVLRYYPTTKKTYFQVKIQGVWSEWQSLDNAKTELTYTQANHGFNFNTVALGADGLWKLANKEEGASAIAVKIDNNKFNIVYSGYTKIPTSARDSEGNTFVLGEYYFMATNMNGGIQREKPYNVIFQPVLQVVSIEGVQYARVDVEEPHDMTQKLITEETAGTAGLAKEKDLIALKNKVDGLVIPEVTQDITNGTAEADDTNKLHHRVLDIEEMIPNNVNPYKFLLSTNKNIKLGFDKYGSYHDYDIPSVAGVMNYVNMNTQLANMVSEKGQNPPDKAPNSMSVFDFVVENNKYAIDNGRIYGSYGITPDTIIKKIDLLTMIEGIIGVKFQHENGIYYIQDEGIKIIGHAFIDKNDGKLYWLPDSDYTGTDNDASVFKPLNITGMIIHDDDKIQSGTIENENLIWQYIKFPDGTLQLMVNSNSNFGLSALEKTYIFPISFINSDYKVSITFSNKTTIENNFGDANIQVYEKTMDNLKVSHYAKVSANIHYDMVIIGRWKEYEEQIYVIIDSEPLEAYIGVEFEQIVTIKNYKKLGDTDFSFILSGATLVSIAEKSSNEYDLIMKIKLIISAPTGNLTNNFLFAFTGNVSGIRLDYGKNIIIRK